MLSNKNFKKDKRVCNLNVFERTEKYLHWINVI